ncbi:MAG TPA: UDP-3-O-(3-hydroxymyristoyl)glucosamine N-acyltransferase [Acidobacteriota bacterium]|nr:UDP-3-O-(3-hydroxymyristoyl)glucosamine N-acyltransferase [Acidobacteriota bacterium]
MYRLDDLAKLVEGRLLGGGRIEIERVRPFEDAGPGDITWAAKPALLNKLSRCRASAVIVPMAVIEPLSSPASESAPEPSQAQAADPPVLVGADNPKLAFARMLALFHDRPFEARGVSAEACIGQDCRIDEPVSIHPLAFLGDRVRVGSETTVGAGVVVGDDAEIGRGCVIHPNVVLYPGVRLGDGVILHSGTVIGADGFGYVFDGQKQVKMEQTGTVIIEDEVEMGANCCVDRATFGATVLERGVKVDNLVHIGHNCRIGENTVIVGCVGVSGSVTLGRNCVVAGQAGFSDHVRVGDQVTVMMRTAVTKDIPEGSVISGVPARQHREELKSQAALRQLPELWKEVRNLRRRIRELEESDS